jgi:hypothetical protein
VTDTRADIFRHWMDLIDTYTLGRALKDLTQEEFDWEPLPGTWGIRRREECRTSNPTGSKDSEWVSDHDFQLAAAAVRGEAVEPMTTIGWLLNHFGAAPGLFADLEIVGGTTVPTQQGYARMWGRAIIPTVDQAVTRFKDGWSALHRALETTTDELLERDYDGHPWKRGDWALAALLNEVSHHGTQICVVRDLYANSRDPSATRLKTAPDHP